MELGLVVHTRIPALGRLCWRIVEFEAGLNCIVKPCLKKMEKKT